MRPRTQKAAQRRAAAAAARKERRKKIVAFGGLGVLALLLVIQGPRMLDLFGSSDPAVVSAPAPAPVTTVPADPDAPQLRSAAVDPFASRRLADADPKAGAVAPPPGTKDPFLQVPTRPAPTDPPAAPPKPAAPPAEPLPQTIVLGKPKAPNAVGRRGWIVVLQSIPVRAGRPYAENFATRARRAGLTNIGVLESSQRKPLRAGYFVVYNGPYTSLSVVQRAADHVRAFGYRTAYVREIISY